MFIPIWLLILLIGVVYLACDAARQEGYRAGYDQATEDMEDAQDDMDYPDPYPPWPGRS